MNEPQVDCDVLIIGAGPSGSVAAALLQAKGYCVRVIEKQIFPRFSIGESLLPQCMEFLAEADLLNVVQQAAEAENFQFKNGAAFAYRDKHTYFDFRKKFSDGWGTTYQVQRASFDHLLIQEVERRGVDVFWGHELISADFGGLHPVLGVRDENGDDYQLTAGFVLDASGFGRVLPRLLSLGRPSSFPSRTSLFTHIEDNITAKQFDREKVLITIEHENREVWFWLIPFANQRSSIGVVAQDQYYKNYSEDPDDCLKAILRQEPVFKNLLENAVFDTPARKITGYSSDVSSLWGQGFALLGNAGEFLDPVFSSGVTIAMKSASLAAGVLHRQLQGEEVDWEADYSVPLRAGVDTFRVFVEAWYDGRFQDIIFAPNKYENKRVKEMVCSILAGYAWDQDNPYVKNSRRHINTLAEICQFGLKE